MGDNRDNRKEFWEEVSKGGVLAVSDAAAKTKSEWLSFAKGGFLPGCPESSKTVESPVVHYAIRSFDKREMSWFLEEEACPDAFSSPKQKLAVPRRESLLSSSFLGLSVTPTKQADPSPPAEDTNSCSGFSFPTTPSCNDEDEEPEDPHIGWAAQSPAQQLDFEASVDADAGVGFDLADHHRQQAEEFTYGSFTTSGQIGVHVAESLKRVGSKSSLTAGNDSDCSTSYQDADLGVDAGEEDVVLTLRVIKSRSKTGLEPSLDFKVDENTVVAGRYKIVELLGTSTFSKVFRATDLHDENGGSVAIKIINNTKESFDAGLDEVRLLRAISDAAGGTGENFGFVEILDYFYCREHLFIVTELLKDSLFRFQEKNQTCVKYFNLDRCRKIAVQLLTSVAQLHKIGIIHADLKPENVLLSNISAVSCKIIDLGSARFTHEGHGDLSNCQSKCYRAPEVALNMGYDEKIDVFSIGCILAELYSGKVLLPCPTTWGSQSSNQQAALIAELVSAFGAFPQDMLLRTKAPPCVTKSGLVYVADGEDNVEIILPQKVPFASRFPKDCDPQFLDFLLQLLAVDPKWRASAEEALRHPWLQQP